MSINAIEVLEARMAKRVSASYPPYHSPEWWDMMWKKHEEWCAATYPPPAVTGYEVTPATGKAPE